MADVPVDLPSTAPQAPETSTGTAVPHLPPGWCRLCWRAQLVWQDGSWWADHIGALDECTHTCHDDFTFLESTS
ncbi:MAG: hypothetical protein OJJ54_03665 [Pseudonocardia sp.]|nr:hypothetical protein [Pseudonocardia sp.]